MPRAAIRESLRIARVAPDKVNCVAVARPFAQGHEADFYVALREQFPYFDLKDVTPALDRLRLIKTPAEIETLRRNAEEFGVRLHSLGDKEQGIVHVVGPQLGLTMPGITVVCGDSHTSTHGAFGSLAFGIGTSEVEHVMATQCLTMKKTRSMLVEIDGTPGLGVTAKDVPLLAFHLLEVRVLLLCGWAGLACASSEDCASALLANALFLGDLLLSRLKTGVLLLCCHCYTSSS